MIRFAAFVLLVSSSCASPKGPVAPSETGECPAGTRDFSPGCGGEGLFVAGCYADCEESFCADGRPCTVVVIDPCGGPDDTCDACGSEHRLCL